MNDLGKIFWVCCLVCAVGSVRGAFAQSGGGGEGDELSSSDQEVESLYDRTEVEAARRALPESSKSQPSDVKPIEKLGDLVVLSPFEDVAVIQRRFLPKTNRFELSGAGFANLNNPFFNSIGLGLRLGYYFTEKYALEAIGTIQTTASRQVTDDLEEKRNITTDNVVTSRGFGGVAFKWNPIYGKITWLNKTIVPFDLNFNLGAGATLTTERETEPTLHIGTSQVFALSKGMAFRWDLMWNLYAAQVTEDNGTKRTITQNDLFLGAGVSFYFPEAKYR
jgi:outer membrane beta-barrel protein